MSSQSECNQPLHVAVDVGGTFTDVCVVDEASGDVAVAKVPSTADPIDGVLDGVSAAGVDLAGVALFRHGTTVATNALITRSFPAAAMVTSDGFRDVLEIGRGNKEQLWDVYDDTAPPYIRRRDRLEVRERIDHRGEVVEPLDEDDARRVARTLAKRGVASVAVCFVNAYANPAHEQRMKEILEQELDGVLVSTSSEVLPQIFEHERFSTTVANAVLAPLVSDYVGRLGERLEQGGYDAELLILHSGGGVMTPAAVVRLPVRLAGSGIAAGAIAARHIATMCGYANAIGLDMGDTSTDISLVHDGELHTTSEWYVEFGHPICFPSVEVLTIGAGGGSIAWLDEAGALHSGPQSAGSAPGPACYDRGGEAPTTTDANLLLGRLGTSLIGGSMTLDAGRAEGALAQLGAPLGFGPQETAEAIVRVANANMADALRLISVRRGYDPRDFALVVFGGGGPLHAAALARELSIPTVIVPPNPGITSALGCLLVDVRHDLTAMFLAQLDAVDPSALAAEFAALEAEGRARLAAEGVPEDGVELRRTIDLRYAGQWRSLTLPVPAGAIDLDALAAAFHAAHEREHHYRRDDAPLEVYRVSVAAIGATPRPQLTRHDPVDHVPAPDGARAVAFEGEEEPHETGVYDRARLRAGARIAGPAVIEQLDSTTLVPPGVNVQIDEWLNIRMEIAHVRA